MYVRIFPAQNGLFTLKEILDHHRYYQRSYLVLENRPSVQMGPQPI